MKYHIEQKKKISIALFIAIALLFFAFYRIRYLVPGITEHLGSCFLYPCLKIQQYTIHPLQTFFDKKRSINELMQRIAELQLTCQTLQEENNALKATQDYMQDVQELIEFKKRFNEPSALIAQILVKHISPDEHFIYVDRGSLSRISVNMIALYKNMIVGHVVAVYPWYSKIKLITDPHTKISVYDTHTKTRGIYRGLGLDNDGELTRVNHLETVNVGDQLFSSGEGLLYPRGYLVGSVLSCESQSLYHTIRVFPAVDIHTIQYCMLIGRS